MAKIPLRAYLREIENLIERGEIDPAIAHAKNILKTYPKSIDTYRLLGKAYLESQRYTQALDILQRVLSVIPDDFISQIGMSIIREDEGNLDQAIWHMERAYEVQPFNPAVQDELRRLYGRRDGVQPPKIRLTRGALVRMYTRGELYPQAIAETLAALAEDPNRTDLQLLLARLYALSKHKIEAIEACSRLLKQLPYCKEALEILTRVLPETNRASDAPYYLQRLYTLDPYAAFLSPNAQTSDQVPEQAVMVEQFNLDMSMADVQTPEWTQNVGVQWEEPEAEDLPDWLNTLKPGQAAGAGSMAFAAPEPTTPVADSTPIVNADQQDTASPAGEMMPDFLKDAGWTQTDRRADDIMKESLMQESDEEDAAAAPAEIPDWLQSIAPQAAAPEEDERTDWLDSILPGSVGDNGKAEPAAQAEEPRMVDGLDSEIDADLPDWLSSMGQDAETPTTPETLSSDVPDWLGGIAPAADAEAQSEQPAADASLDWLSGIEQPAQAAGSEATPDWMASLAEPQEETPAPASDMPDWLKGLGDHPNDTQMLDVSNESVGETFGLPEAAATAGELPSAEETAADVPGVPDWLQSLETEPEQNAPSEPVTADASDAMGWMGAFGEGTPSEGEAAEGEAVSADEAIAADIPEWMQGLAPTEEEQNLAKAALFDAPVEETAAEATAAEETTPAESAPTTGMPDMNDMDATMAWLEGLAAKQGADEGTLLISSPDQRSETAPDWLQQQPTEELTEPVMEETSLPEAQAADLPDWLADLSPIAQEETVSAAEDVEEFIPGREQETVETGLPLVDEFPIAEAAEQPAANAELAQPDLNDVDATMAWLEALAAKQGADEATLITPPDQRTETPPEWLQQAASDAPADELPAVESQPEPEAPAAAADLPEWLQGLDQPEVEEPAASTGFARIYDAPQQLVEPSEAEAEPVWPVDSFAGDQIAQEAAEMPAAVEPVAEAQPETTPTAEAPAAAQDAMPDLSDMDAAMAWLESLAAKQGADEATLLISNPEQRSDTPPEWIQQQAAAAEELSSPEASPVAEELPEVQQPVSEEPTAATDLPDWLASLDQPEKETDASAASAWPVDSFASEELAQQAAALEPVEPEAAATAEVETTAQQEEAPTAEAATAMPDMNDMDAAMAWLEALAAKQGADEATLLISDPEQRSETPPEWIRKQTGELKLPEDQVVAEEPAVVEPVETETLPDWLQVAESEETTSAAEKTQPLSIAHASLPAEAEAFEAPDVEAAATEATAAEETAAWLESLNRGQEEGLAEEAADETPETTQASGEMMPQWLTSLEEESETAEYLSPEDETAVVPVDISSAWVPEEAAPEAVEQQEAETVPASLALSDLQAALRRGDLDRALEGYGELIQNGQMLDETIRDLRDALYRYPVDIMIWQTLGDAYSRNDQLQEALDAYTKAEELLR